jgi:hypothetical protein
MSKAPSLKTRIIFPVLSLAETFRVQRPGLEKSSRQRLQRRTYIVPYTFVIGGYSAPASN